MRKPSGDLNQIGETRRSQRRAGEIRALGGKGSVTKQGQTMITSGGDLNDVRDASVEEGRLPGGIVSPTSTGRHRLRVGTRDQSETKCCNQHRNSKTTAVAAEVTRL